MNTTDKLCMILLLLGLFGLCVSTIVAQGGTKQLRMHSDNIGAIITEHEIRLDKLEQKIKELDKIIQEYDGLIEKYGNTDGR